MSFMNKVVIVTGASSGIGAATALLFGREGARVAIVGRNETKLNKVAQQIAQQGSPPLVIKADVSNEKEASTIVKKTVDHFGKLDVLVNNAGFTKEASITSPNYLQIFDDIMNTNLRAVVHLTSLAAPHLVATKGNIVNVSSVAGQMSLGIFTAYCVSKASLDHYTRCSAMDLAASGVRVNSVNPGPVRTDLLENAGMAPVGAGDEAFESWKNATALGKTGDPQEIADLIAFLASDRARSVTGSIYVSDNGMLLK